ncbi:class A beta-lactamase-related serine hydrolase [Mycobacterium deserti]|uniref:Class A beta-lactamase-related serine hydrolase n=1 Tax=Mycobacterium deserti TaxID=2978347 RepID=A0ABT2MAH1_9MYCO|nr:class A beta-lactamase-related serine hydrolase [Mycobacterium deserti]MCT7659268.1 class A beta-lactamase-related serine hydrolase [Mycobacterium deserti]
MRRGPSKLITATAAVAILVPIGTGCEASVYGMPPEPSGPQLTVIAPQGRMAPLPEAPPDEPAASFAGLAARAKQATADAAKAGAEITTVVLDRNTGQTVSNGNNMQMPIASVVKLFIADDLLLQEAQGRTRLSAEDRKALDFMLRASDDSAAEVFWNRSGGSAIIERVTARYSLDATETPYNGRWFNTLSTTGDLVRYYDKLLAGSGGLPPEKADIILSNLAASTPTAPDGTVPGGVYPQRFGIPEGFYAEPVAVKQGWFCCWNGGNWVHLSTGVVGPDRRYVMAIGSMHPADDATARTTITQAVKTMFPGGHI